MTFLFIYLAIGLSLLSIIYLAVRKEWSVGVFTFTGLALFAVILWPILVFNVMFGLVVTIREDARRK